MTNNGYNNGSAANDDFIGFTYELEEPISVKGFSVTYDRKFNTGNFESLNPVITIWVKNAVPEGEAFDLHHAKERVRRMAWENVRAQLFLTAGCPVISVDTKKKELIGNFRNQGSQWTQQPEQVNVHDFQQDSLGRAVPFGIYDLTHNQGYIYVGNSFDTSEFAAFAIAQWWADPDRSRFRREDKLLILADAGGSNNCRYWLWKQQVQEQLADQFGIAVTICHYPTGASKWNPIEYRLFSQISRNWAGKPLRTWEAMLNYIRGTVTETGLQVKAFLIDHVFEKQKKVSAEEKASLHLQHRPICPTWNYIIKPRTCSG